MCLICVNYRYLGDAEQALKDLKELKAYYGKDHADYEHFSMAHDAFQIVVDEERAQKNGKWGKKYFNKKNSKKREEAQKELEKCKFTQDDIKEIWRPDVM